MSNDQKELAVQCGNCMEEVSDHDIELYDAICPMCWTPLSIGGFIERGGEERDFGDFVQYTDDVLESKTIDLLFDSNTTLCCDELHEDMCECEFPEKAPTFDSALNQYLSELPEEIYDTSANAPCLSCAHCWNGGCEPLRTSLHLIHMRHAHKAAGADDVDDLYLGSIDGCINYTLQTVGETYVRQVSIRARRE